MEGLRPLRNGNNIYLVKLRIIYNTKITTFKKAQMFNKLPNEVKMTASFNDFKQKSYTVRFT